LRQPNLARLLPTKIGPAEAVALLAPIYKSVTGFSKLPISTPQSALIDGFSNSRM